MIGISTKEAMKSAQEKRYLAKNTNKEIHHPELQEISEETSDSEEDQGEVTEAAIKELVLSQDSLAGVSRLIEVMNKKVIENFDMQQRMITAVVQAQKTNAWKK
jgi:hypothetical protein